MRFLIILTMIILVIGCGGGGVTNPDIPDKKCVGGNFGLNDKGDIIVYYGDYWYIQNYRCEDCHGVEHRKNP